MWISLSAYVLISTHRNESFFSPYDKKWNDNEGGNFWRHEEKNEKYKIDALNDKT